MPIYQRVANKLPRACGLLLGSDANSMSNPGEDIGHPRGTLAIVALFGLLLALAWLAMYVFLFLERGAPRP
jgi:hypothetical protein